MALSSAMNAQFVAMYRTLCRQLHRAARERPHYLYELRFVLSRPLLPCHTSHTVTATFATAAAAAVSDDKSADDAVRYLCRPASECMSLDVDALYTACRRDVRDAIEGRDDDSGSVTAANAAGDDADADATLMPTLTPPAPLNAVATQMLRYRELLWLRDRLACVLSKPTYERLCNALRVAAGPTCDDFIPDDAFDVLLPSGSSSSSSTLAASAASRTHNGDNEAEVHSAGAIGLQREMFVLRRVGAFALARHFLRGDEGGGVAAVVPRRVLERCAHDHAALRSLIVERVPTSVTCGNAALTLTARVRPFDEQYTQKEQGAHVGYFAHAHRRFMLHVCVTATPASMPTTRNDDDDNNNDNNGKDEDNGSVVVPMYVQLVNTYFVRLDVVASELIEEVGYMHSVDVRRLLQERDLPGYSTLEGHAGTTSSATATTAADATTTVDDDDDDAATMTTSATDTDTYDTDDSSSGGGSATAMARRRDFALCFVSAGDEPTVLKGLLYYKVGNTPDLQHAPVQALPFGPLLLQP